MPRGNGKSQMDDLAEFISMNELLEKIALCVEYGKIDARVPYPPELQGEDGVDELTRRALEEGIAPADILQQGLVAGMRNIGVKFRDNLVYVPQVLMSAKAMNIGMKHLKPYFASGAVKRRGTFIIGTVAGDLHDIGKNLVAIMIEGNGWEVVDLGTNVPTGKFLEAVGRHPGSIVGISALLTTTMLNMESTIREIKAQYPRVPCIVGGAPLNAEFAKMIGADAYSPDPQGAVDFLNNHHRGM